MIERSSSAAPSSRQGILWMLLAALIFASQDAIAKHLSPDYPTIQILFARFVVPLVILVVLYARRLPRLAATRQLGLQLVRSIMFMAMLASLFTAYRFMPLADANAIMFIGPVLVTALSFPVLGERVGRRRWTAVLVGLIGTLVIVRPGSEIFQWAAVLAFAAAFFTAFQQITIRILSRTDTTLTTLFFTPLVGAAVTSVAIGFFWVSPDLGGWLELLFIGLLGILSQFAMIKAFEMAPAATVSPFLYSILIWAILYGFLLFGHFPDAWTIAGSAIVIGSGLYILRREPGVVAPR